MATPRRRPGERDHRLATRTIAVAEQGEMGGLEAHDRAVAGDDRDGGPIEPSARTVTGGAMAPVGRRPPAPYDAARGPVVEMGEDAAPLRGEGWVTGLASRSWRRRHGDALRPQ
jgi:hypothetical protein